jgi:hypothetical protein
MESYPPAMTAPAASSASAQAEAAASGPGKAREVLGERWPSLGRALNMYQQNTAEQFSQIAYEAVQAGLIRHEQRQRLAATAEVLGIRPFDAQLLVACAIRQWALDHRYDSSPTLEAPALSFEYKAWKRVVTRAAIVIGTAVALDVIVLLKWLS